MPSALCLVPGYARAASSSPRHQVGASGFIGTTLGMAQSPAAQTIEANAGTYASKIGVGFSPPITSQALDYVLNNDFLASLDPVAVAHIADLVSQGKYGDAAVASIELLMSTFGGPVGVVAAGLVEIMILLGSDAGSPCTIPGCGSTCGLGECDLGFNPYTVEGIAQGLPALPALQPYHFNGLPNRGPTNMLDWGSYDWAKGQSTLFHPGGPGSFEEALQQAVIAAWDKAATPPYVCATMKTLGTTKIMSTPPPPGFVTGQQLPGDCDIGGPDAGPLISALWTTLCVSAGVIIGPFVKAWNAAHPGPQRKISYTVPAPGTLPYTSDILAPAFWGMAWAAGVPIGSTVSVIVNDPRAASEVPAACWPFGSPCTTPPANVNGQVGDLLGNGAVTGGPIVPRFGAGWTAPVTVNSPIVHPPPAATALRVMTPKLAGPAIGMLTLTGIGTLLTLGMPLAAAGVLTVGAAVGFVEALREL